MKKILAIIISIMIFAAFCSVASFAADDTVAATSANVTATEPMGTSDFVPATNREGIDLINSWEKFGYPDDIGAAYYLSSTSGFDPNEPDKKPTETIEYIVYVVSGTSDERKAELVALFGGENIVLRECSMSKNTQNEYVAKMKESFGKYAYLIYPTASLGGLRIDIYYPEENDETIRNIVAKDFADAEDIVKFNSGVNPADLDGYPEISTETIGAITIVSKNNTSFIWFVIVPAALALAVGAVLFVRVRAQRLALSNGETVDMTRPVATKKEVEESVRKSELSPSDKVYENISKKL